MDIFSWILRTLSSDLDYSSLDLAKPIIKVRPGQTNKGPGANYLVKDLLLENCYLEPTTRLDLAMKLLTKGQGGQTKGYPSMTQTQ